MPYVLPTPEPRRRWYNDYGETQGIAANLLFRALLGQAGAGGGPFASQSIPNPGYGQTGSPGASFQPMSGSMLTPPQNPQQLMSQVPRQAAAPYATKPMLNPQQFQNLIAMQKYQQEAAQAPVDLAYKKAQTASMTPEFQANLLRQVQGLAPNPTGNQLSGDSGFTQGLQTLRQQAEAGDEKSVERLRMILQLLQAQ